METNKSLQPKVKVEALNDSTYANNIIVKQEPSCVESNIKEEPSDCDKIDYVNIKLENDDSCDDTYSEIFPDSSELIEDVDTFPSPSGTHEPTVETTHELKKVNLNWQLYICDVCNISFLNVNELLLHLSIHIRKKKQGSYSCDKCDKTYTKQYGLNVHKRGHTGERPYNCDQCSKSFASSSEIKKHKTRHLGLKGFPCDICDKSFYNSVQLKDHRNRHLGIKPYMCEICTKSFTGSSELKKHKNTHLEVKPFPCSFCEKSFPQISHLKKHTDKHLGLKPYICEICQRTFATTHGLQLHRNNHLGLKPFACKICHMSYASSSGLSKHKQRDHGTLRPVSS